MNISNTPRGEIDLLKFLNLVAEERRTVAELAQAMSCTTRTIYRRVNYAIEAGFEIDTKPVSGIVFLDTTVIPPLIKKLISQNWGEKQQYILHGTVERVVQLK